MSAHIVDVNIENAQNLLIDESLKRLVLVLFWSPWCEDTTQTYIPRLEKLAQEYGGRFLLAKVNAYDEQMLTSQFQVQAVPSIYLMKDGQPVDGYADLKPENELRELLDKFLPKPWELAHEQAKLHIANEEYSEALNLLREAYEQSQEHPAIGISYAMCLTKSKRLDEADEVLGKIRAADQDALYEQVKAEIALSREAQKSPELEALEKQLEENPDDKECQFQLALQYSQQQFHKEALQLLYSIILSDMNYADGEAKKNFLDIIAVLGKGDPVAVEFQRKLYTLLY